MRPKITVRPEAVKKSSTPMVKPAMITSLSQILIKCTAPGIPDIYQGAELWDLSLVDPDNRRPVDFPQRTRLLNQMKLKAKKDSGSLIRELLRNWQDSAIKLYITYQALNFRKTHRDLFLLGDYISLTTMGPQSRQVVAFARRQENSWVVAAAGRLFTKIFPGADIFLHPAVWEEGFLSLPDDAPKAWRDIFTGETIKSQPHGQSNSLALADLFRNLPVALLFGRADS